LQNYADTGTGTGIVQNSKFKVKYRKKITRKMYEPKLNVKMLKTFMVQNDITNNDLAKLLDLSPSSISHRLIGDVKFKRSEVFKIGKKYNIFEPMLSKLFYGESSQELYQAIKPIAFSNAEKNKDYIACPYCHADLSDVPKHYMSECVCCGQKLLEIPQLNLYVLSMYNPIQQDKYYEYCIVAAETAIEALKMNPDENNADWRGVESAEKYGLWTYEPTFKYIRVKQLGKANKEIQRGIIFKSIGTDFYNEQKTSDIRRLMQIDMWG
jgi:hypothetical protein